MKKVLLAVALCVAVLVAVCLGTVGTAYADQAVAVRYVTADYADLGTVYAIDAHADSVAILHAKDGVSYLSVMGGTTANVALSIDPALLADKRIALYDGKVAMALGDKLSVYDCAAGTWRSTAIPTYTEVSIMGSTTQVPLTHFAVDERGTLFVAYQLTILGWVPFDDVYSEGDLFGNNNSTNLSNATQNYTAFSAHGGICYFYRDTGSVFIVDTNGTAVTASETTYTSPLAGYDYADGDFYLRDGVVQRGSAEQAEVALDRYDDEHTADSYLRDATAFCTSYDGTEWRLWVVDNGQHAVKCYGGDCAYRGMYGTYGADDGRLNAPTQVAHDALTVVNDSGNQRTVVLREGVYTHIDGAATAVATAGDRVYVAAGRQVDCYDFARPTDGEPYTLTPYYLSADVLSVAVDGTILYALTADELYMLPSTTPIYRGHARRVRSGRHAGIVYVQTDSTIVEYKDGETVGVSIDVSGIDLIDFAVDYCGNVYVLAQDGSLLCYDRLQDGYADAVTVPTDRVVRALDIHRDGDVYALSDHALCTLDLEVSTRDGSAYPEPTWDDPVSVIKITETVWGYACPNNYESIVKVPAGTYAMKMASHAYLDEDYYYVEFALDAGGVVRNERVYVPRSAATAVGYEEPASTYVRFDGTTATTGLYPYPSYSAEAAYVVPKADAVFRVLRVMGVEDGRTVWPWYMVRYDDRVCYVAADNYVDAAPPYEEVERYYARCVANKLGEKVPVFASPDADSEVVATLVDGTKIELTAPYDSAAEYTCIRIDDREVYIRTANVTTRALTNGQTFALIMSVVVICAAAVTLVLYLLVKKGR